MLLRIDTILLRELRQFNPQLVDKHRVLAVTKSDMLDDELTEAIAETLPDDLPHVFISAVTGQGITQLKDLLWRAVTDDANRLATPDIATQNLTDSHRDPDEDAFIFDNNADYVDPEYRYYFADEYDEDPGEDLRHISREAWNEAIAFDDNFIPDDHPDDPDSNSDK